MSRYLELQEQYFCYSYGYKAQHTKPCAVGLRFLDKENSGMGNTSSKAVDKCPCRCYPSISKAVKGGELFGKGFKS